MTDSVPLDDRFSSVNGRIIAAIIDNTLLGLLLVINLTLISEISGGTGLVATSFISVLGIPAALTALFGWTPGKRIMGLRVTTADAQTTPPGWIPGVLRTIPIMFQWIPVFGLLVAALNAYLVNSDPERRSIFDRIAQTRVVKADHL